MAFNFRPKSVSEIRKKKKSKSVEASQIYQAIMDEYNETIILDPTTSFNKIKVPREVAEKVNITQLKNWLKNKKKIDVKREGIDITFGNGSGGSGGGTSAVETAEQENATRLYCEVYMEKKKFPTMAQLKKVYPKADEDWIQTFEAQAIEITKWIGKKGYEFSRDEDTNRPAIMPHLENIALKKCGVRTKDSWNPADIYAVQKTKKAKIMKELVAIGDLKMELSAKLDALNDYMRSKIISKELIGISLKKLSKGKVKTMELTNTSKRAPVLDIKIIPKSIKLNLDLNKNNEFQTGELSLGITVEGHDLAVQVRAFSGGVRESTQMDMTGKGAAAKLGKVSAREALDPYLSSKGLKRRMGTDLPKVGQWTEKDIKQYVKEWKELKNIKINKQPIDWGKDNWETTLRKAVIIEQDINRTASQLSAKLQAFQWIKIFEAIERKGKLKEFLTILYYGAKKEYSSAGPFLKVA
jgi:hypothetical protein